jgi:hypothetical protein
MNSVNIMTHYKGPVSLTSVYQKFAIYRYMYKETQLGFWKIILTADGHQKIILVKLFQIKTNYKSFFPTPF